ncbi:MAG: DUF1285 domain-containing protein [Alphaproteobacteria bacterium]|nr:DUF1285 domain-containing protein [Alphaproteobacteria bacterium]
MENLAKIAEEQFDISIAYDGTWMHQGAPMTRMPLVRLFATVLQRDAAGEYWLITPAERGRIVVEDAPFVITGWRHEGETVYLTDNLGREVPVDVAHPLTLRMPHIGGPFIPYQQLGGGVEARVSTAVYYDLVELALREGGAEASGRLLLASGGGQHPLGMI